MEEREDRRGGQRQRGREAQLNNKKTASTCAVLSRGKKDRPLHKLKRGDARKNGRAWPSQPLLSLLAVRASLFYMQ